MRSGGRWFRVYEVTMISLGWQYTLRVATEMFGTKVAWTGFGVIVLSVLAWAGFEYRRFR